MILSGASGAPRGGGRMSDENDRTTNGRTTYRRDVLKALGATVAAGVVGTAAAGSASAQRAREYAQTYKPEEGYAKAYSHVPAHDDGYVLCGYQYQPATNEGDYYLTKVGSDGTQGWATSYSNGYYDHAYDIVQTEDGGYACCGYSYGEDSYRYSDVYMVKTDGQGEVEWQQTYSSDDQSEDRAYSLYSYDDGYVLGGTSYDYGGEGSRDYYVVDVDNEGSVNYQNQYSYRDDWGWSVKPAEDDGYVMAGYSSGEQLYDDYDYRLSKYDSSGDEEWSKTYSSFGYNSRCYEVVPTNDGGYAMGGYTYSPSRSDYVYYLVKTDSDGELVYDENYYYQDHNNYCYSLDQTSDAGYILYGYAQQGRDDRGNYLMVKTGPQGEVQWYDAYRYGYDDVGWDVNYYDEDDSYTTCGYTSDEQEAYYAYLGKY